MLSKDEVVKIRNRLGFEFVRVCSAEPFIDYERALKERIQAGLYADDLIHHEDILLHPERHTDPSADFSFPSTVVSCGKHHSISHDVPFRRVFPAGDHAKLHTEHSESSSVNILR